MTDIPTTTDRLLAEGLVRLSELARALPARHGRTKRMSGVSLWRWATRGIRGVTLEAIRMPDGNYVSSRPALVRFLQAIQRPRPAQARPASDEFRERQEQAVLQAMGVR